MLARYPNLEFKQWSCMLLANRVCMLRCYLHIHNRSLVIAGPIDIVLLLHD